jgi:D-sedoheptulose 7-phosphate isomerase
MTPAMQPLDSWLAEAEAVIAATRRMALDATMDRAVAATVAALQAGQPLLVCGNGGSAADAQHIAAELVGRFLRNRRALPAICLSANAATLTACGNDFGFDTVFSRQVEAYGRPGGVLLGLSTSGNSPNIVAAMETARRIGMFTIGLTGEGGGRLAGLCDHLLAVPSRFTPAIQQAHLCLYHHYCSAIEAAITDGAGGA